MNTETTTLKPGDKVRNVARIGEDTRGRAIDWSKCEGVVTCAPYQSAGTEGEVVVDVRYHRHVMSWREVNSVPVADLVRV